MKVKIAEKFYTSISPCNMRQWCMELLRHPNVEEVKGEEYADIGINTLDNVKTSVYIDTSDIQSLVYCYDVDLSFDANILKLNPCGTPLPSQKFGGNKSKDLKYIAQYDYYCNIISPSFTKKMMQDKLPNVKFLNLYHSLPEDMFKFALNDKIYDFVFQGSMRREWYPLRQMFHEFLKSKGWNYYFSPMDGNKPKQFLYGSVENQIEQYEAQMSGFASLLRSSKMMLLGSSVFNIAVKKYIECMASGCLVVAPMPKDGKDMGFRDGYNMVVVDEHNFMQKAMYYYTHPVKRERIVQNARKLFEQSHTLTKSVNYFLKQIEL